MAEALCRHDWQEIAENPKTVFLFCHKCSAYRAEPKREIPEGDLYYLEET